MGIQDTAASILICFVWTDNDFIFTTDLTNVDLIASAV